MRAAPELRNGLGLAGPRRLLVNPGHAEHGIEGDGQTVGQQPSELRLLRR